MTNTPSETSDTSLRALLGLMGAAAGLAVYLLIEVLPDIVSNQHLLLFITVLVLGFFTTLLGLTGPMPWGAALKRAAILGLWIAGLVLVASLRFEQFQGESFAVFAGPVIALLTLPLPFMIAAHKGNLWSYGILFDEAWALFVRGITAVAFLGLFWAAYFLCNALLELVGIPILEVLAEEAFIFSTLSGLILGLAAAVLFEMSGVIETLRSLALRLLGLLLPPFTAVAFVFLIAVPVQGLERVFRGWSAAATILIVVLCGITLIAASNGARQHEESRTRLMQWTARGLSLLLPVLAAIGVYAIWLRVGQYGWTPERLLAMLGGGLILIYALAYGAAALTPVWQSHQRRFNVLGAVLVCVVSALWLTPLMNAQRIAAQDQLARFLDGRLSAENLPLRKLRRFWGQPGEAALSVLEKHAEETGDAKLAAALIGKPKIKPTSVSDLLGILPVMPVGKTPDASKLAQLGSRRILIMRDCENRLSTGAPGCVALVGEFDPVKSGEEIVILTRRPARGLEIAFLSKTGVPAVLKSAFSVKKMTPEAAEKMIIAVQKGEFSLVPSLQKDLMIGTKRIEFGRTK